MLAVAWSTCWVAWEKGVLLSGMMAGAEAGCHRTVTKQAICTSLPDKSGGRPDISHKRDFLTNHHTWLRPGAESFPHSIQETYSHDHFHVTSTWLDLVAGQSHQQSPRLSPQYPRSGTNTQACRLCHGWEPAVRALKPEGNPRRT